MGRKESNQTNKQNKKKTIEMNANAKLSPLFVCWRDIQLVSRDHGLPSLGKPRNARQ